MSDLREQLLDRKTKQLKALIDYLDWTLDYSGLSIRSRVSQTA